MMTYLLNSYRVFVKFEDNSISSFKRYCKSSTLAIKHVEEDLIEHGCKNFEIIEVEKCES